VRLFYNTCNLYAVEKNYLILAPSEGFTCKTFKSAWHAQVVEKRHERWQDKANFDEKAEFMCDK
jgi:hypothetical protein